MKRPSLTKFREAAEASNGNLTQIARIFGVGRVTVYRWAKNPEYRAVIDEYRGRLFDEALEAARQLATGIPIRDDEGNIRGWIERPEPQTVRYILSTLGKREGFGEETTVKATVTLESLTDIQLDEVARRLAREIKEQEPEAEAETPFFGKVVTQFNEDL